MTLPRINENCLYFISSTVYRTDMPRPRHTFLSSGKSVPELDQFEAMILDCLIADGARPKYGREVAEAIEKNYYTSDEPIRAARFYEAVKRLDQKLQLIEKAEPAHREGPPSRVYWKINGDGETALVENRRLWTGFGQ